MPILIPIIRHALTVAGGALVLKGYISEDAAAALVNWGLAGATILGGILWSLVEKRLIPWLGKGGGQ
jgi:hypothetical protein